MCSAHRSCPHELDNYQSIIMDLAVRFGGVTFYVYHRCFSAATASCSGTSLHTGVPSMWILSPVKCPSPANSVAGQPTLPSPAPFLTHAQQPLKLPLLYVPPYSLPPSRKNSDFAASSRRKDYRGRTMLFSRGSIICKNVNNYVFSSSSSLLLHICTFCSGANAHTSCPN